MANRWLTTGNTYGLLDGVVYLKVHESLNPFVWGGRCMRLDESTETLGGLAVTTRQNPRGGIERDTVRAEPPGETTGSLVMKRLQADRAKSDLRSCYWDLDLRIHCGGLDRDAPFEWEEITRYCFTKMSERTIMGSSWEADEDALVTFGYASLSVDDIFRVGGSEKTTVHSTDMLHDVTTCQAARCPDRCDDQEECVIVAVTETDVANSYLLYNLAGGAPDFWLARTLTGFGVNSAVAVTCLGSFVVAVSTADTSIIYSDDLGVTQVNIDQATVTDWTANAPAQIDAIDQTFIVVCGANGYIFASYDAARTWTTISAGEATTSNLTRIMIARDNPMVIYAVSSAADVVIKSENGGESWFACTGTGTTGTGPTALYVVNQNTVLIGTDAGEIFETVDGGVVWTEQVDLPNMTTKADVTVNDITGCGCGSLFLSTVETGAGAAVEIYRNVDGGASGRWYVPDDLSTLTATNVVNALACCGPNHAIGVGGVTTAASTAVLLE